MSPVHSLILEQFCAKLQAKKAAELVRRIRRLGRRTGTPVRYDPRRGKGSHGRLYYGDRAATIIDLKHEIGQKLRTEICRQLGIEPNDL